MLKRVILLALFATSAVTQQSDRNHGRLICPPVEVKVRKKVMPVRQGDADKYAYGNVTIEVVIDKEGFAKTARFIRGNPLLAKAVFDALQKWRWSPYKIEGKAVETEVRISFVFRPNADSDHSHRQLKYLWPPNYQVTKLPTYSIVFFRVYSRKFAAETDFLVPKEEGRQSRTEISPQCCFPLFLLSTNY